MSNNENQRGSECYGLLNTVPCARWGSVFYHGPCPRASASRPGICVDSGFRRCNLPANRGGRCAHVCCDAECLADLTKALELEENCRCRCNCCRCRGNESGEVCSERACRIRCRREPGDWGEDRGDLDCCSRRCRCHRPFGLEAEEECDDFRSPRDRYYEEDAEEENIRTYERAQRSEEDADEE